MADDENTMDCTPRTPEDRLAVLEAAVGDLLASVREINSTLGTLNETNRVSTGIVRQIRGSINELEHRVNALELSG